MRLYRLLALALPLALIACNDRIQPEQQAAPSAPPVKKVRVALVMKTLTNPFFIEMEKGARKAAAELNLDLIVKTAAEETSFEQQVAIVDDLVQKKLIDALVVAPADAYHLIPSVIKARDAGIAVVNIDARLDPKQLKDAGSAVVPFISVDNEQGGFLSAKTLIAGVTKPTQAAIIEGIRTAENAQARKNGAVRAFASNRAVKLVASESANWKIDEAYTVTKSIFAKHPNIGLIFAANDMMALGVLKYLADSGHGKVKVAGFDALAEARTAISQGTLVASIDQQAAEQGYQGVLYAMRAFKREQLPAQTLLNVKLVTIEK
ncbi:substrate-binding domain-containing protein [Rhodoferax sp.]|uniref:substrate-binding domain-containing protein n=1 Tax=Rhodoferax sp. TaxID=50421 RepID=UPI002621867F|nr:substrate-binding domain-containing protein [Rhodoferax sp.]MDD2919171.1 substrate-binding domain-containing protein [Rhodoferax sp.]